MYETRRNLTMRIARATLKELFHNAPDVTKCHIIGIRNRDVNVVHVADADGNIWVIEQVTVNQASIEGVLASKVVSLVISLPLAYDLSQAIVEYRFDNIPDDKFHLIFDEDGDWLRI